MALLSGEIIVEQRLAVLNRFREGKEKLLITTNVCARGIDVEQVNTSACGMLSSRKSHSERCTCMHHLSHCIIQPLPQGLSSSLSRKGKRETLGTRLCIIELVGREGHVFNS